MQSITSPAHRIHVARMPLQRLNDAKHAAYRKWPLYCGLIDRAISSSGDGSYQDLPGDADAISGMLSAGLLNQGTDGRLFLDVDRVLAGPPQPGPRYPFCRPSAGNQQSIQQFREFCTFASTISEIEADCLIDLVRNEFLGYSKPGSAPTTQAAIVNLLDKRLITLVDAPSAWGRIFRISWSAVEACQTQPRYEISVGEIVPYRQ